MDNCPYKRLAHNFSRHSQMCAVYSVAAIVLDTSAQKNALCDCGYNKAKGKAYAFICGCDHSAPACTVDGCKPGTVRKVIEGKHEKRKRKGDR